MSQPCPQLTLAHPKIVAPAHLAVITADMRTQGHRIVFTNGCYDILHPGHVDLLSRARLLGDALVLALNTDASVKRLGKGAERPVQSLAARAYVAAHLGCVDYVTYFDQDTPYELIALLMPHVLVKGGDWAVERIVGRDIVEVAGGLAVSLPLLQGYSTTAIVTQLLNSRYSNPCPHRGEPHRHSR